MCWVSAVKAASYILSLLETQPSLNCCLHVGHPCPICPQNERASANGFDGTGGTGLLFLSLKLLLLLLLLLVLLLLLLLPLLLFLLSLARS